MKPGTPPEPSNLTMETLPGGDRAVETALVGRAAAGDREAFRELVDRHRDRAYGLALRIVRSAHDAEDVAQEAFVRAWLALPRFRGDAGFGTWLHRIVARRAFDRLEEMKRRRGREAPVEAAEALAAAPGGGGGAGRARRLERLVAALPPAQRAAVTLFYYEDRSVEQVAAALGIPVNTVKTHLSRARAALREGWGRVGGEESA